MIENCYELEKYTISAWKWATYVLGLVIFMCYTVAAWNSTYVSENGPIMCDIWAAIGHNIIGFVLWALKMKNSKWEMKNAISVYNLPKIVL